MATRQSASRPRKGHRSPTIHGGDTRLDGESVPEENVTAHPDNAARRVGGQQNKAEQKSGPAEHVYGVPMPEGLHDAIEIERDNLSKAESLLGCLAISLEYGNDSVTGPYYPDVAQIARDLVRKSINGLDSFTLQQYFLRNKVKEETGLPTTGEACSLQGKIDSNEASARVHHHFFPIVIPLFAEALAETIDDMQLAPQSSPVYAGH